MPDSVRYILKQNMDLRPATRLPPPYDRGFSYPSRINVSATFCSFHQTVGVTASTEAIGDVAQPVEEERAVSIIEHDVLPGVTATRDMVDGTGIFKAERSCHSKQPSQSQCAVVRPDHQS